VQGDYAAPVEFAFRDASSRSGVIHRYTDRDYHQWHLWSVPPVAPVVMHIQPFGLCVTVTAKPDERISTMLKKR